MYRLIRNIITGKDDVVLNTETNTSFICDPDNTDYQAYLAWLAESPDNKPLPADE